MSGEAERIPVQVVGVRVEMPSNNPIVLLREEGGSKYLPIWIGAPEARAIDAALQGEEAPRPQTHDLLMLVLEGLGASLVRVVVTDLRDAVFYADLVLAVDGRQIHLSSRPSDAIALAVRARAPVFVAPAVLAEAGIEIDEGEPEQEEAAVIEKFRQALEDVTVEDFLE
jgi:hypothetical protein